MRIKFDGNYENREAAEGALRALYKSVEKYDLVEFFVDKKNGAEWIESVTHRYMRAAGYDRYRIQIGEVNLPIDQLIQM